MAVHIEYSPRERLVKITEILAEGVLGLIQSVPHLQAGSQVKVSEKTEVTIVSANSVAEIGE